jgi:hypothetical protein
VRRRTVEVVVVLLHVFPVVALAVGEAEKPFLDEGVFAVPEGVGDADALLGIGNAPDAVFAPAVGPAAGVVER